MEELHELKNRPVAKFASNNRSDIDLMWMVLKCKIASAKKLVRGNPLQNIVSVNNIFCLAANRESDRVKLFSETLGSR